MFVFSSFPPHLVSSECIVYCTGLCKSKYKQYWKQGGKQSLHPLFWIMPRTKVQAPTVSALSHLCAAIKPTAGVGLSHSRGSDPASHQHWLCTLHQPKQDAWSPSQASCGSANMFTAVLLLLPKDRVSINNPSGSVQRVAAMLSTGMT